MGRAGAVIIAAALLALAGCKSADSKDDDKLFGGMTRPKNKDKEKDKDALAKGPTWLDDSAKWPGAGTGIPKGTNPKDPKIAAQELISGRVLDPNGKPARNIFVRVDQIGAAAGPAEQGVYTNNEGYFQSPGQPGKTYELTAEAAQDGHKLVGVVQTRVPNATLLIVLREDLAAGGTFPPTPKPSDKVGDNIPPTGLGPKSADGGWGPGGGTVIKPPATIGGTPGGGGITPKPPSGDIPPPAEDAFPPSPKPSVKPENFVEGPRDPLRPPPASIPGPGGAPPVPPLPALPPSFGPTGGGRSSMKPATVGKIALVDTLDRGWDMGSVKPGSLALIEFVVSNCENSQAVVPVMKDLQSRYGANGLQLGCVVCDDLAQKDRVAVAAKYSRDNNLNYAVYVEPGAAGSVRDRLGVAEYPHALLIDSTGKVLWRGHPGDRAKLEAAIKQNLSK